LNIEVVIPIGKFKIGFFNQKPLKIDILAQYAVLVCFSIIFVYNGETITIVCLLIRKLLFKLSDELILLRRFCQLFG